MTPAEFTAKISEAVAAIRANGYPDRLAIVTSRRMGSLLAGDGPPPASITVGSDEIAIRYSEVVSPGSVMIASERGQR